MSKSVVVVMVVMLASCATPYQRADALGGYNDKHLPDGDWLITVMVNAYTTRGAAFEYLHRRAGELCPTGYDIIDRTAGDNGDSDRFESDHKPEEDAVVRCHAGEPAAETPAAFWCATNGDGTCWPTPTQCNDAGGGCVSVTSAWCSTYVNDGGKRGSVCSVSASACVIVIGLPRYRIAGRDFDGCAELQASGVPPR